MGRQYIVGRQQIVGAAQRVPVHDWAELEAAAGYAPGAYGAGYDAGAEAPLQPMPRHMHPRLPPVAYSQTPNPHVIEEHPTHTREFPIGFVPPLNTPVPPAQVVNIETKPQVLFRGERLAIPNSLVLNFQLTDIKVGKDSQLAAPGNLPAECFSNVSIGVRMQLDTAEPGITLTLSVQNTDTVNPHTFSSVLYGTVME